MLQNTDFNMHIGGIIAELEVSNNEIAFRNIYATFWKKMFAIAYSRLNDKQEAEDIVHDVFVSLWANRNKVQILSLEHYLATAVKNLVFTKLKKRGSERTYFKSVCMKVEAEPLIENTIHNKRILEQLQGEIEALPEKCKQVFKYSRNNGMPVKQIAQQLCISPKTVENHLNKALKHLRLVTQTFL